jgi:ligand-binding sensor domain-containing protein/anti-sigma regulatory factor (Ser/Thr protein kinase)
LNIIEAKMRGRFIAIIILSLSILSNGLCQSVNLNFDEYNYENGLSSNRVQCMAQDSEGFLWIGTVSGLNRFDGNSFEHYFKQAGKQSLAGNYIMDLVCLPNHRIAIATTNGLSFLDTHADSFHTFRYGDNTPLAVEHNIFNTLSIDRDGDLWAGTECEIFIFDRGLRLIKIINGPYTAKDIGNKNINWIWRLTALPDGNMLAESDSDLSIYNIHSFKHYSLAANPDSVWSFLLPRRYPQIYSVDKNSNTWFLRNSVDSLFCYDWKKHSLIRYNLFKNASSHHYLYGQVNFISPEMKLLYLPEKGLYRIDSTNSIQYVEGIPANLITMVFLTDHQNNLWIGTSDGLFESSPVKNNFHTYSFPKDRQGLIADNDFISRIQNDLWISSDGNGFFKFNIQNHFLQHYVLFKSSADLYNNTWNIQSHTRDTLWIGTSRKLIWFVPSNTTFGKLPFTHPALLDSFTITTQYKDREGLVWMGIGGGHGLVCFDSKKNIFRFYDHNVFPLRHPSTITEDEFGNLWLATQRGGGLVKWTRATNVFSILHATDSTPFIDNGINSIAADLHGHLWLGTASSGLIEYDLKNLHFTVYGRENGLSYERIDEINTSAYPYLWIITSFGLNRFNFSDKTFESFFKKDGLPADELSSGNYFDSATGNMYVGWESGIIQFDAVHFYKNENTPSVFINKVFVNDTERHENFSQALSLNYRENNVIVDFTAVDLINGSDLKFRYRLSKKNDWINLDNDREIHFSNLSPGNYSLLIEVSNKSGLWSEKATILNFFISPPFWKTIWFYFLIILLVVVLAFLLYRFRIHQLKGVFEMRNRIAQDLHDDIGSTMTAMNFTNELAMQKLNNPYDAKKLMLNISDDLRGAGETLDDIVWMVNPKNDSIEQVMARMRRFASRTWEAAGIDFTISFENIADKTKLNMEQRHDLYLIFKEAINNVAKHSSCAHADASIHILNHSLCLEIKDNGTGFDIHAPSARNGLSNMKSRIEKWKGDFSIQSSKDKGTHIFMRMPITQKGD